MQRRRHPGRDGRRAVGPGAQLRHKHIRGVSDLLHMLPCLLHISDS